MLSSFSLVWLFMTPWSIACQAPLSMGFFRQEYWSGLPCPPPGESFLPRDRTHISCIEGGFFTCWAIREALLFGLTRWCGSKESICQCRRCKRCGFNPWVRKISWRRKWQPTPVFLPGNSHDRGAWWTTVHEVTKSWIWPSNWARRPYSAYTREAQ